MRVLESEKLLLKPVESEDIAQLLEIRWDQKAVNYIIHEPISLKQQQEWYNGLNQKNLIFSVFFKSEHSLKLVGSLGFMEINMRHQRARWTIRLSPEIQGQGIGFEASSMLFDYGFNTLNLEKICSDVLVTNHAIIRIHEKLGCELEGTLRSHYYHQGQFRDALIYGCFKNNFKQPEISPRKRTVE